MQEYVDFLGRQSPYDRLEPEDLARLGRVVEVEFFGGGATIVVADGPTLDHLYIIRTGSVHVVDRGTVVDELGPGDTFGHISVLSGLPPALSVAAVTDTVCYRIPDPRTVLEHSERLRFSHYNTMVSRPRLTNRADRAPRAVRDLMREPLWCEATTSVRDAAIQMSQANQSSVIFQTVEGLGIMTDSDCRRLVATGRVPIDAAVRDVGTVPVRVVQDGVPATTAFVEMVMHGVHHLVVVNASGKPVGVARVMDLSSTEIRNPLTIRAAIDRAETLSDLVAAGALLRPTAIELHDSGVPPLQTSALVGAMSEAIVERCISLEPVFTSSEADLDTSWLVLGSMARGEPLPWSDIDTGLVWQWRREAGGGTNSSLVDAAERVIRNFEACSLARCPDGANASNPLFNRSNTAWLAAAHQWMSHPQGDGALLLSSIVADSRPITGLVLGRSLTTSVNRLAINRLFLKRMLDEALTQRPPTGFVRDFVVEANGRHRGQLNLKRRGLGPVVALGRWLAVTTRAATSSTQERLEQGADAGLLTRDEADILRGAHREMFELLFRREIDATRESRPVSTYLDPRTLDSLTRRHLRESFRAIAKVQSRLEGEWVSRVR